jgi:molecular chaperone DnaJ
MGGAGRGGVPMGSDINLSLGIGFMDAVRGVSKAISFDAISSCEPCSGSGLKPGAKPKKCQSCGGSGQTVFQRGGFLMSAPCGACGGEGTTVPQGSKCSSCSGKGKVKQRKTVEVDIPAGVQDGSRIRLSRQGHAPIEGQGPNGDLFVTLKVCAYY